MTTASQYHANRPNRMLRRVTLFIVSLVMAMYACLSYASIDVHGATAILGSDQPEHLVLTWQEDPKTRQSFTWRTSPTIGGTVVELIRADLYHGFPDGAAMRFEGSSFLFDSDLGTMRIHEVEASGLQPGTTYMYRVGDGMDVWSPLYQFDTEPEDDEPFTFIFMSDTQAFPNRSTKNGYGIWADMLQAGLRAYDDARFLLLSGDIVDYGDQQQQWELWFDTAKEYLPNLPIVPTVGNHDVVRTGEANFRAQFQLPLNGPEGEEELAYSFDYGNMHMVVLNSEGDLEKQAEWLVQDMMSSDKQWKIVAFHRSPYHTHPARANADVRRAWTHIFDQTEVDLVLSGHDHAYMRSWPMYDGEVQEEGEGTVYVIGGTAGSKFYEMGNYEWIRVGFDENIQIVSGITIDADRLHMQVLTRDGRTVDTYTMIKSDVDSNTDTDHFLDVPVTHWAHPAIIRMKQAGIINGLTPVTFAPDRSITRAEFATILVRALALPRELERPVPFRDLDGYHTYTDSIAAAYQSGIVSGISEHQFAPGRSLTREQLAVMIGRAYEYTKGTKLPQSDALSAYQDSVAVSDWAYDAVNGMLTVGLMNGRTGGWFTPNAVTTRAEAAVVLDRMLEQLGYWTSVDPTTS